MRNVVWALLFSCGMSASSVHAATLKVLTYNTWGAPVAGLRANERMPLIGAALPQFSAGILAIEEAFRGCLVKDLPGMILKGSKYPYYTLGPSAHGMKCVNSGVIILSKFPILERAEIVYNRCTGSDCFSRKGMVYARILVPSIGEMDVYATHTNAAADAPEIRQSQVEQMISFVGVHSGDHARPVIILGDLNATPDTKEIQTLVQSLDLRDLHEEFISGRDVSDIERNGYTADPTRNANLFNKPNQPRKRIDYILYREAAGTIVPSQVANYGMIFQDRDFHGRQLSDHFGVQSALNIADRSVTTQN